MRFIETLRTECPLECFDEADLKLMFRDMSTVALYSALTRALRSKDLLKIRRGLYIFGERHRKQPLSKFIVASKLYSPSYISFESALAHHGLIPEAVYVTTSACFRMTKKTYQTTLGDFTYQYIPVTAFRLGVESLKTPGGSYLLADPIKALFDTIYVKRKKYDNSRQIQDDLRLDENELRSIIENVSYSDVETLSSSYKKKVCDNFFKILMRELK